jgi:formylglycine-generating enzyme
MKSYGSAAYLMAFFAFTMHLGAQPLMTMLPDEAEPDKQRLIWSTDPGIRYELQETSNIDAPESWTTVAGYPTEAEALAQQALIELNAPNRKFYRVVLLDEQPPEIVSRNPAAGAFGIGRYLTTITIRMDDMTGVDPGSIGFTVGNHGTFTLADSELEYDDGVLSFWLGGDTALGGWGHTVTVSLAVADIAGNSTNYMWSFELEKELVEAPGLFLFGSLAAQANGQRVGNIPTRSVARRYGGPAVPLRMNGSEDWELEEVGEDFLRISYSGSAPPAFTVGQPVANLVPETVDDIFYRVVTGVSDDPAGKLLTLATREADFWEILTEGSFSLGDDVMVFDVDEDGRILRGVALAARGGTVELPAIVFNWSGRTVMGTYTTGGGGTAVVWGEDLKSPPGGGPWTSTLTLDTAKISITPVFSLEADMSPLRFRAETTMRVNPEVAATFDFLQGVISLDSKSTLWSTRKFKWIPKTPLWIEVNPRVDFVAKFDGGLVGAVSSGARANVALSHVVDYEQNRSPQLIYGPSFRDPSLEFDWPPRLTVGGTVGVSFSLVPEINLLLNSLAGIYVNANPTIGARGTTSLIGPDLGTADLTVFSSANLNAGVKVGKKTGGWLPEMEPFRLYSFERKWVFPDPGTGEPLAFLVHPQAATVPQGGTFVLQAQVNRSAGVSFEWIRNGSLFYFGGDTLSVPNVTPGHAGDYRVMARSEGHTAVSDTAMVTVIPAETRITEGLTLIPSGSFLMGDHSGDGGSEERPVHMVHIHSFHMDRHEVTESQWRQVYDWALTNGYTFDSIGFGKEANHPVCNVNWYDAVKWCNALSEMSGLTPAYYTSPEHIPANIYSAGKADVQDEWVLWNAGYRLPTEAEWEYAARGGISGFRFPWGEAINHYHANYRASGHYTFDSSHYSSLTYHPAYYIGGQPYTSPIGRFAPNDFGLYDMVGNIREWTWDWLSDSEYQRGAVHNPRGPNSGSERVTRGGSWANAAPNCRISSRLGNEPDYLSNTLGFRVVLPVNTSSHPASISLSGDLAFGEVAVGSSETRSYWIANTGEASLNVASISYPSGFKGDWDSGGIPSGGTQSVVEVTVTFSPTQPMNYSGHIVVHSDASSGLNALSVSGTGIAEVDLFAIQTLVAWDNEVEIFVGTQIGNTYELQRSTDLMMGGWSLVGEVMMGVGGVEALVDDNPPPGKAFYRVATGVEGGALALSENAVGYITFDVPAHTSILLANPFESLTGLAPTAPEWLDNQLAVGDAVYFWDPVADEFIACSKTPGGWTGAVTERLEWGRPFWIVNNGEAKTVLFMGEVPDTGNVELEIVAGLNVITYPYPIDVNLAALGFEGHAINGDQIQVGAPTQSSLESDLSQSYTYIQFLGKWVDSGGNDMMHILPAGEGLYYRRNSAQGFTWSVSKPYM